MKIPVTPLVIEPTTFWLVAISLNQLHCHVPQEVSVYTAVITLYKYCHSNVDGSFSFPAARQHVNWRMVTDVFYGFADLIFGVYAD